MRKRLAALAARGWNGARTFKRAVLLGVALTGAASVFSAPADVARGLAWLEAQVQAQGQLATESGVAAQQQARCETAQTLIRLSAGNAQIAALVASLQEPAAGAVTESLACWQQLRQQLGETILASEVETRRIGEQGYSPYEGGRVAGAVDTGWALAAQLQKLAPSSKTQLLAWLQTNQRSDGSFAAAGTSELLSTAVILRGLKNEVSTNTTAASVAAKAADFLLRKASAQGTWLDDVATTAIVFEAVHPYTTNVPGLAVAVRTYLLSHQQEGGSWQQDPFITAVALRALVLSEQTPQPVGRASLRLRVLDATSRAPVPNAQVELQVAAGTGTVVAQSGADGQIVLADLSGQGMELSIRKPGYGTLSALVQLTLGQTFDLGDVLLQPALSAAAVSGIVRDTATGLGIAGAQVTVEPGNARGTTDASGFYSITGLPSGPVTVVATKSAYSAATASGTLATTQSLNISFGLTPMPVANVSGIVLSAQNSLPLANVKVGLYVRNSPTLVQYTAADGRFSFPPVPREVAVVQAELPGYKPSARLLYLQLTPGVHAELVLRPGPDVIAMPDLRVMSVDKSQMSNDANTLSASGSVKAEVINLGRSAAPANTHVAVFEDRDGNRRYDPAGDQLLGSLELSTPLQPGDRRNLLIPVTGTMLFRDNAIYVFADSGLSVTETDETNNVEACACATGNPFIEDFNDGVANGVVEFQNQGGSVANWTVRDGYYGADRGGGAAFGDSSWVNYDAEVNVLFPSGAYNDAALAFRIVDSKNWYQFRAKAGHARILSSINGVIDTHAEAPVEILGGRSYRFRVEVRGKVVRAFLDGRQIMRYDNLKLHRGKVGVMQEDVLVRYDDLRVFEAPIFEEDFSGTTHQFVQAGFTPLGDASASVVNGALVRKSYGSSWSGDREWSDYTAQVDIRFPNGLNNDAGLVILAKDAPPPGSADRAGPTNFAYITLNGNLVRFSSRGGVVRSKNVTVSSDPNAVYQFRGEVSGKWVRWFLNDEFLFDYDELPWNRGAIGLMQDGVTASYDNFKVWRTGANRPDLTISLLRTGTGTQAGDTRVAMRIGNGGHGAVSPGVPIQVYLVDAGGTRRVASAQTTRTLDRGGFEDLVFDVAGLASIGTGTLVAKLDEAVDGSGVVFECNETNNAMSISLVPVPLRLELTADRQSYRPADAVRLSVSLANVSASAASGGGVDLKVIAPDGQEIALLPAFKFSEISGSGRIDEQRTWLVPNLLAGAGYAAVAALRDEAGYEVSRVTVTFAIEPSESGTAIVRLSADRQSYSAAQVVQLISRVGNTTTNAPLESVQARTEVKNTAGQSVFTQTEVIAQLAPGGQRQYSYGIAASGLAVGNYTASLQLLNAQGAVLSQSSAALTVLGTDQSGIGLTGQLQAMPSVVLIGRPVALNLNATNSGNTALSNVPVTVRIVEPVSGAVVASFSSSVANWPRGTSQAMGWSWTAQGLDGQTLVAVASSGVGGRDVSLGQANIRLVGVPQLKAEPSPLDFPLSYVGESAAGGTSTVASVGTTTATAVTLSLGGANASQFVLPDGGCTQTANLPIGATCTLTVSYRPNEAGNHNAEARIGYANAADVVVNLTGQARPIVLTGSVTPEPGEVHIGQPTSLGWSVSNPAAISLTAHVTLSLLDASGQTVASWPVDPTVGANATTAGNQGYTLDTTPQTLAVVLSQSVAGSNTILATSTLVVTEIPVKVDPVVNIKPEARILVLVSCPQGETNGDDTTCVGQRSQGIASYLDVLGITHKVVSTQVAFKRELCCGTYNTYWISGGAAKLAPELVGQLREAIWAGASLITDGVHDSRNHLLHGVNGIVHRGKLPTINQNASILEGAIYAQGALPTLGQPLKAELVAPAKVQAWFTQVPGQQAPIPAIVSNRYGEGNSLLFAFDLAGMVTADPQATQAPLREAMIVTASRSTNGTQTLTIADLTALAMSVANQGTRTAAVEIKAGLPAGVTHHSANIGPTTIDQQGSNAGTVTWTISLGSLQSKELIWRVLARQVGVFELPLAFYSVPQRPGETARLLDSRSFTLNVQQSIQLVQDAPAQVQALQPSAASDKSSKTKALDAATQAASLHGQGRYQEAITQWLAAADVLITIGSADTSAARDAVAKALEASTDAMCAVTQQ